MIDAPTNSASASNYCVWNQLNVSGGDSTRRSMVDGNLQTNFISASFGAQVYGSILANSGKWYAEFAWTGTMPSNAFVGWEGPSMTGYYYATGAYGGNQSGSGWATYAVGDIIGVAVDNTVGSVAFYKNNVLQGTLTGGAVGANGTFTANGIQNTSSGVIGNFGQRPFIYTPPSGFSALNTNNLPLVTINNGAQYMAATLYTGNGTSQSISNGNNNVLGNTFYPDLLWQKSRSNATDNIVYDTNRGANYLVTNTTAADAASSIIALTSTGFNVGSGSAVNANAATYVTWQWNAGSGTTATNTNGTITSTVSANQTAGFSVVTFSTQTSGTGTVGHGLGVAPSLILLKLRTNVNNWDVYHSSVGNTKVLYLNLTTAATTDSTMWNNTSPTSSVFTLGTYFAGASQTGVAYCFTPVAGYSAFGSYTGNGSSDGPFIYLGFRPRWLIIKRTDTTANWQIFDTSRSAYNAAYNFLEANTTNTEFNQPPYLDFLSNGFKPRGTGIGQTDADYNITNGTYIYAAFAENPFNIARAR